MAKVRDVQASFVSGALDSRLFGRIDTDLYGKAASRLENVYVTPQGGVFRREGLEYVDTTTSSAAGRLIPFEFNDEQTYMLVFTAGQFKVYRTDSSAVQATVSSSPVSGLTANQISEMRWTQSADTLYLVHKDVQPIKITRTSDVSWTASSVTFTNIAPFAFSGTTPSNPNWTVTPDVTSGEVTLTGSATPNFTSAYEGQYINMPKGGRILVKSVTSTSVLEGVITIDLANTSAVTSGDWELESGYEDVISATKGWPRSVAFYKGRLWLGGLNSRPQTLLASKIAEFEDLDIGSGLADEGIDITIDDDRVNIIYDIFPGRGLQIFTSGSEYTIRSDVNDAVTPGNVVDQLRRETSHGSGPAPGSSAGTRWPFPVSVDGATVFGEAAGGVIRQFVFNETEQSFNANNISVLSQNIINAPVAADIRRSVTAYPNDFLYVVNGDGTVAVLNSLREQDLLAWTKFTTTGTFEDVAVSGREVYFIVKRTINSATVRYIEKLNADHFMDASESQDNGSPTTSWSSFSHLEAEEVTLRGDDYVLESQTVSSGAFTTDESVTVLEAGLNFAALIETLPVEVAIQGESFSGQFKSLVFVNTRLYESRNVIIQYKGQTYTPSFRQFGDDVLDDPIANFTGLKKVHVGGYNRDAQVIITQTEPLEFNVLGVILGVKV